MKSGPNEILREVSDGHSWQGTIAVNVFFVQTQAPTPEKPTGTWELFNSESPGEAEQNMHKNGIDWDQPERDIDYKQLYENALNSYHGKRFVNTVKKIPIFASIVFTGGTLALASYTGKGIAIISMGLSFDDLSADVNGETLITKMADFDEQERAYYSGVKLAFAIYSKGDGVTTLARTDLSEAQKSLAFANWFNSNYILVDGVLTQVDNTQKETSSGN